MMWYDVCVWVSSVIQWFGLVWFVSDWFGLVDVVFVWVGLVWCGLVFVTPSGNQCLERCIGGKATLERWEGNVG